MRTSTLLILFISLVSTSVMAEPPRPNRAPAPHYQPSAVRYAPQVRPAPRVVVRYAPAPVVYRAPTVVHVAPRPQYYSSGYYDGYETNHTAALVVGTIIGSAVVGGLIADRLTH